MSYDEKLGSVCRLKRPCQSSRLSCLAFSLHDLLLNKWMPNIHSMFGIHNLLVISIMDVTSAWGQIYPKFWYCQESFRLDSTNKLQNFPPRHIYLVDLSTFTLSLLGVGNVSTKSEINGVRLKIWQSCLLSMKDHSWKQMSDNDPP